ncbi:discoidin domain-containing protein [Burkholderia ambifaria]|uniref:discoidin domain-containing protein n=1 Tax=Burkholderia ambifaria TaxID=152480 RepID=UPI001E551873|nr:discoidin domain-containing protein [Burkholderia ambifaria]UEP49671.1 discoidin domain-containing protein [Burkholderia ambifaria]
MPMPNQVTPTEYLSIGRVWMYRRGKQLAYDGASTSESSAYNGRSAALAFRTTPMDDPQAVSDVWTSSIANPVNQWIEVDFGADREVDEVTLVPLTFRNGSRNPQTYAIQCSSDGHAWTTVYFASGADWTDGQPKRVSVPAQLGPAVDLDFVRRPTTPTGWRFMRSTTATYFDAKGVQQIADANEARFDHDPATAAPRGLLLEGARTNYFRNSDAVEAWTLFDAAVSTDGTTAVDGQTLARVVTEDSVRAFHAASQSVAMTVGPATFTYWHRLRKKERSAVTLFLADSATADYCRATFDLASGVVTGKLASGGAWGLNAATIVPLADDWWECRLVGTVTTATTVRGTAYLTDGDKITYPGDGVSGVYSGGSQLELSGFATSSILTGKTAATRAVDLLTNAMPPFVPGDGTMLLDAAFVGVLGGGMFAISFDDGVNNGIGVYKTNGSGALNVYVGNAMPLGITVADGQRFRVAIAWTDNGVSASTSINGRAPLVVANAARVSPTAFSVASARGGGFSSNLWVRAVQYWPYRIADADLSDLTRL